MERDYPAVARRNERLYYAFVFLMEFGFWIGIWIKYLTVSRGFELKYILLMDMPFWLVMAALEAPFGALADKIGHSRVLAFGAAVYALTILGFGFTTNYWMLFADYMLWAIAMACRSGADHALLYDSLKQANLEDGFARIAGRGFAISISAATTGIVLGGFLASATSLSFTVQISCIAPVAACVVALSMVEPHVFHERRPYLEQLKAGVSFTWNAKVVRYSVLMVSVLMMAGFAPVVLVQPFLIEHDVATGLFGVYQAPLQISAVIAALTAYRIVGRLGRPKVIALACGGMITAFLGLAAFDAQPAFAFFALPALCRGLIRPTMDAYINQHTPSDMRATVLSMSSLVLSVALAFFEPIIGFITDDISINAAFAFVAAFFIVAMPPLYLLWRRSYIESPPVLAELAPEAAG
ncbi:MAG TPA: MFS transporter [Tepidiformaceae bacterium]|nr:MFS transporter [Tepidiformaceae bacterium]